MNVFCQFFRNFLQNGVRKIFTGPIIVVSQTLFILLLLLLCCLFLFCFVLFFETGFFYIALATQQLTQQTKLTSSSQRSFCLCLPGAEIKGVSHYPPGFQVTFKHENLHYFSIIKEKVNHRVILSQCERWYFLLPGQADDLIILCWYGNSQY